MTNLIKFDYFISRFLNQIIPHNQFFDYFFSFFSLKGSSIFIWLLIILIVIILEEKLHPGISKKDKQFILIFSLSFLLTAFISNNLIKNFIRRPRPTSLSNLMNQIKTTNLSISSSCPKDFSFPSTHAATAFASANVLYFFDKKRRFLYFLTALIISYSRIYLGCHYFFDVFFGAIVGIIISNLFLYKIKN